MSEYQSNEVPIIDRSLSDNEQAAVSQLSSRVKLRSNRAAFTYSWGHRAQTEKAYVKAQLERS